MKIKTIITKQYQVTNETTGETKIYTSIAEAKKAESLMNLEIKNVSHVNSLTNELVIDLKNPLALDAVLEALKTYVKASKVSTAKPKTIKK